MENTNIPKTARAVPSSITVNVRPARGYEADAPRETPKGLLAALIAVGSLLVIGVAVVAVLLVTHPSATAASGATPAAQTEAQATPEPTATPTTTPVPTTPPEETDDFSAIFDAPENPLLEGLDAE